MKKIEDKQFITDLIENNKKQLNFLKEEKKRKHKKQHCIKSSCKDSKSEYYIPKKRKQKKMIKDTKGPTMKMKMIMIT